MAVGSDDTDDASGNDSDDTDDDEQDVSEEDSDDDDMLSGSVIDSDEGSDVEEEAQKITVIKTDSGTSKSILKQKIENNSSKERTSLKQKVLKKSVSFDESVGDSDDDDESRIAVVDDDDIDDSDIDNDDDMGGRTNSARELISEPKVTLREDIYGRLRDDHGNVVPETKLSGAYIPPAKRLEMAESDDSKRRLKLERLKKQLKGLVNRYGTV